MASDQKEPKVYLDYLDKEMTIMGILSTFCVAAASLVVDRVGGANADSFFGKLTSNHGGAVFTGAGLLIAAALSFYLQRSSLALSYGLISLDMARPKPAGVAAQLEGVNFWTMWFPYRFGFMFLMLATVVFSFAFYQAIDPLGPPLGSVRWTALALIVIDNLIRLRALTKFPNSNKPIEELWRWVKTTITKPFR